ncbi:MAG: cytochrome c biogenesis protein ResB, partial [Planctomycetota bacterium]
TSKLRIVENGQTVAEKTIRVNDPLKHRGYAIYQSSYDPEAGQFSGLQIVKDPGIPVVYSGFGALCFGVIFIFYIKPFLRKKQKKGVEE